MMHLDENGANKKLDIPLKGIAYAAAAFFSFSVMVVFSKMLTEIHHPIAVSFYRNAVAFLPMLFIVLTFYGREFLKPIRPKPLMFRCILGTVSLIFTFWSFSLLPLADATALLFSSSLIITVLSGIFLKEKIGPYRAGAVMIGFIGVLIMCHPTGNTNLMGLIVVLTTACLHAVLQVTLRYMAQAIPPITVTFYFVGIGALMTAFLMPFYGFWPQGHEWWEIIALGLTGALGQYYLSNAFRYAEASTVTVFNYTGIIWATLFGFLFWGDIPTLHIILGGAIVITCNVFIVLRERIRAHQTAEIAAE